MNYSEDFFRHKKSHECQGGKKRQKHQFGLQQERDEEHGKKQQQTFEQLHMSSFDHAGICNASVNTRAGGFKNTLQLETDEAAVISLLANQLSQQQTQLTGPVLQDEGKIL